MQDKLIYNRLLDFYENLLTDKQKEICQLYFREDFSLTEIAEELNISRAGVHDVLKRCQIALNDYESKLHCVQNYQKRYDIYEEIKMTANNEKINELIDRCLDTEN
ncbi:MAG: YlxM family DNA-binding protein [Erysipelotrichaceae bacterium]|nr:YlxM family DNA-binding protein [Erysipelotrichaceae bacterium]